MCRYAQYGPYKEHYACFTCRKCFRQTDLRELPKSYQPPAGQERVVPCPQCGRVMHNLGFDFQAPPQDAIEAWAVVQQLYIHGIAFHSCGCGGPGYRPTKMRELEAFLADVKPRSIGERLLEKWQPQQPAKRRK